MLACGWLARSPLRANTCTPSMGMRTILSSVCACWLQVNKGSSVPKKLHYVTGLRGAPTTEIKVLSLELDVHGQGATVKPVKGRL